MADPDLPPVHFDGRAILVTGGGRGLGETYCRLLASRGARIVVADNGSTMDGEEPASSQAESVANAICAAGGEAFTCTEDLSDEGGATRAVEAILDHFGRIDGLIHNASTVPQLAPVDRLSTRDLDMVMRINAYAGLWMARAAWPAMQRQQFGRIVLTTSVGIYGSEGTTPYCAAKAANIGIMRCLAEEGAPHGICVNVVAPSARTRMTEHFLVSDYARWFLANMPPEKVATGTAWLVSEKCEINGEIIVLGGGRIARLMLDESRGVVGTGESIEEVRDLLPGVFADEASFRPANVAERSATVAAQLGFEG